MYDGVPRNKDGYADMHLKGEDDPDHWEHRDEFGRTAEEAYREEDNPEGYLGEVDEEGMKQMHAHLKEKWRYYERNITYEQRPEQHQFKVGEMVELSPEWRDIHLGNYSNPGDDAPKGTEPYPDQLLMNDAYLGPLFPGDVGVVIADDNTIKPYKVKSLGVKASKNGFPFEFTDNFWYMAEALVKHVPPQPLNLRPDATVLVPDHFRNVKLALVNLTEGQKLLVKEGEYRFEETMEVGDHPLGKHPSHRYLSVRTLNMSSPGPASACKSWGRFVFGRWARGWINNMTLLLSTRNNFKPVLNILGGPWELDQSSVRSAGGICVKAGDDANFSAYDSSFGGFAWPIGPNAASDGILVTERAAVGLQDCLIDKTGSHGGVGIMAKHNTLVGLMRCRLLHNDHHAGYDHKTQLVVVNCTLKASRSEAFYGGKWSLDSRLVLRGSEIEGPPFFRARVPGEFGLVGPYPGDNIIAPLPGMRRQKIPGQDVFPIEFPINDDRMYGYQDFATVFRDDDTVYSSAAAPLAAIEGAP